MRLHRVRAVVLTLSFTLSTMFFTTFLIERDVRHNLGEELQGRTSLLGQTLNLNLRSYQAALEVLAQSYSAKREFDPKSLELEARRIGLFFGGWFTVARDGDVLELLMSTASEDGRLPAPLSRSKYPEVVRAEEEAKLTGTASFSDAFLGRLTRDLVVAVAKPLQLLDSSSIFIYFSVTLKEITSWLEKGTLGNGSVAVVTDGSHRIIARSEDNNEFLFKKVPAWYIDFFEERSSGVGVAASSGGGPSVLVAMQRLEVAPNWVLTVSKPLPSRLSTIYSSPWPALSGLIALLLSGSVGMLYLGRKRALLEVSKAVQQTAIRDNLLAEVRAADSRKARLIAVLAHDLRTPLVAILGRLDLFRNFLGEDDDKELIGQIKHDGHGMLQLIDDVLELAKLGDGEANLRPETFSPKALLSQVAAIVFPAAESNETEVCVKCDDVPLLIGDVLSIRRILLNFTTNAIKAAPWGKVELSATIDVDHTGDQTITFSVTDNGDGIATEDLPLLFRDFGRLEREDITNDGTGLGLAICRRLADAMGGHVGVESAVGEGARFWLRLTLPKAEEEQIAEESQKAISFASLRGLKILVAEDHETIRQLICADLSRAGAIPTGVANGEEAVATSKVELFDLILMDLQMPRLDGGEAAKRIRTGDGLSAKARIIGLTAHQLPEIAVMLSELCFDACLRKPLKLEQLTELIQNTSPILQQEKDVEDFDSGTLTYLKKIDGGALLTRTLTNFSLEIEESLFEFEVLIEQGDTSGTAKLAHKLAGFCDMLGARLLSDELRNFQALIYTENVTELHEAIGAVKAAIRKTQFQISLFLDDR
jgi:signal transduction histidine kinase/FixJ family two-component response regulator/HPt (histidine-containing phosphotransfer) domain-containing protein